MIKFVFSSCSYNLLANVIIVWTSYKIMFSIIMLTFIDMLFR